MIARCETCPFWKRSIATNAQNRQSDLGDCQKSGGDLFFPIPDPENTAGIVTHKTFGCVMHPMNKAIA